MSVWLSLHIVPISVANRVPLMTRGALVRLLGVPILLYRVSLLVVVDNVVPVVVVVQVTLGSVGLGIRGEYALLVGAGIGRDATIDSTDRAH